MHLLIKYFRSDLASLASLKASNKLPPALSPPAGNPGWLSVSAIFLRVSGVKGPRSWPARRMEGSENKGGQVGMSSFFIFTFPECSFTTQIQVDSVSQARKGKEEGKMLLLCQNAAYLPQPQPPRQRGYKCSRSGLISHGPQAARGEPSIFQGPHRKLCTRALLTRCWRAHPGHQ